MAGDEKGRGIRGDAVARSGSVYDPNDALGRMLFNVLAMVAEF